MGPEEALGEDALSHLRPTPVDSLKSVTVVSRRMPSAKGARRREEGERRRRDGIREAVRRAGQSPAESLLALAAHSEALLKLRKG